MRRRSWMLAIALAALAAGTTATATTAREYSFTRIADTADGFSGFGCPALNNLGAAVAAAAP